jgi:6-pyruvoyltetrahydropterin/6-carboxytetrahydropterin synthase
VVAALDHRNLNLDVPEFRTLNPTAENIAIVIWRKLADKVPGRLVKIVLWETPRNCVEYRGT